MISMKRFMSLAFALVLSSLLIACGGSGSNEEEETCPTGQTGTPPNCVTPSDDTGDDPDPDDDANNDDDETTSSTGGGSGGGSGGGGGTPPVNNTPTGGTYDSLRDRILAAEDSTTLQGSINRNSLTENQRSTLIALIQALEPLAEDLADDVNLTPEQISNSR